MTYIFMLMNDAMFSIRYRNSSLLFAKKSRVGNFQNMNALEIPQLLSPTPRDWGKPLVKTQSYLTNHI